MFGHKDEQIKNKYKLQRKETLKVSIECAIIFLPEFVILLKQYANSPE